MNNKQLIATLLVLWSCGFFMVTDAIPLEFIVRHIRSLEENCNSSSLSTMRNGLIIVEDVYLPVLIGRKLTGQHLEKFQTNLNTYCESFHPLWDILSMDVTERWKLNFNQDYFEFLKNQLDVAKPVMTDICENQEKAVDFAKNGRMDCVITRERELLSCLKKQSPKSFSLQVVPSSGQIAYHYPSKEEIQKQMVCIEDVIKECSEKQNPATIAEGQ